MFQICQNNFSMIRAPSHTQQPQIELTQQSLYPNAHYNHPQSQPHFMNIKSDHLNNNNFKSDYSDYKADPECVEFEFDAEHGNESPESALSESSIADPDHDQSEEETKQKDPQDLTYDEITKLLGPNDSNQQFLNQLFEEEEKRINSYRKANVEDKSFLDLRLSVVHSIMQAVRTLSLDCSTAYKAMYYFDRLASKRNIHHHSLHFVAFTCLWIAAKFNETAQTCPHIDNLINAYCKHKSFIHLPMKDFIRSEKNIMSQLKFKLKCVLPIDFIEYYLHSDINGNQCIFSNDRIYHDDKLVNIPVGVDRDIAVFSRFFLNIACENYELINKYKPSILAIAVICCARRALKITPYFNPYHMLNMFKISDCGITQEIDSCFNELWNDYGTKFPNEVNTVEKYQNKSLIEMSR